MIPQKLNSQALRDPMEKVVTPGFLRSRYWATTAAILLSLAVSVSVGYLQLNQLRGNAGYFEAFVQMMEAESQLEVEILRARVQSEKGPLPEEQRERQQKALRDLMLPYTALRAVDEDGVGAPDADREEEDEAAWDEIARYLQIDAEAAARIYSLDQSEMPWELQRIWEAEDSGGDLALEEMIGELIELAQPLVMSDRIVEAEQLQSLSAIHELAATGIRPAFKEATRAIRDNSSGSASLALTVLLAAAAVVGLVALGSAFLIYEPMARTVTEKHRQTLQERDRAIASEEAKRRFLAVMSHEIRTPMNGVMGFANLLLGTGLNAKQRDYVETIQSSGSALLGLLNDILDFSRMEAGSLALETEDFAFEDVVTDVVTLLGAQAAAKRLELASFIDPTLPRQLRGDSGRLRQVLINLVGNAIKFTESGAVTIEIRSEGRTAEGDWELLISIADTGLGIPEDKIDCIFDRFTQVDTSATRKFEGSGLGLAICKEIVLLLGGEIGVDSMLDKGSTFWVRLRLKDAVPPAETLRDHLPVKIEGRKLLVVDDNALNRRVFKLQLEGFGAEVDLVSDARSALTRLTSEADAGRPFDLAIIDHMMPETDGVQLCKQIRSQPRFLGLPLILASSGIEADPESGAFGFDAYCPKPVLQNRLLATISELLEAKQTGSGASRYEPAVDDAVPFTAAAPARLLLVEDNAVNQRLVATVLKEAGYLVDIAADGVEAVQAAKGPAYDLILMDIHLPILSGVEAARRIRALDNENARCPIFAMTANAMEGDREEYIAAGMDDYVPKPIDIDKMMTLIEGVLATRPARPDPAADQLPSRRREA